MYHRLGLIVCLLSFGFACAETGNVCEGAECSSDAAAVDTQEEPGSEEAVSDEPDAEEVGSETQGGDDEQAGGEDEIDVPVEEPSIEVSITSPESETSTESGTAIVFEAAVTDPGGFPMNELVGRWISDRDGVLFEGPISEAGNSGFSSDALSSGFHQITFRAETEDGTAGSVSVFVGICGWTEAENFNGALDTSEWIGVPGSSYVTDAYRDERGWLEMTGNTQNRKGAIFNVGQAITPGNVVLRFKISTGQCYEPDTSCNTGLPGADGFAMSVFQVASEAELIGLLEAAYAGGGLGYGVSGGYGVFDVPAFHIEFDTWHNVYNGNSEHHSDPMADDHIAVTVNGDPGEHYLPTALPDLEDNLWHQMEVRVVGEHVTVSMDDVEIMDGDVPGLTFKGGFIGFTGSTGYYTNYHRFDDLEVEEACRF